VNSTPAEGITARLVYVAKAEFAQLKPRDLEGQIAVVESAAAENWPQAAYFGARAILVLEARETTNIELRHHELYTPVNIPRFYIPDDPADTAHHQLVQALRTGKI